jgi:hypothetical protein
MLITNFNNSELEKYQKAVTLYNKQINFERLYILDKAFDCESRPLNNYNSLHTNQVADLTEFWKIFDNLDKSFKVIELPIGAMKNLIGYIDTPIGRRKYPDVVIDSVKELSKWLETNNI